MRSTDYSDIPFRGIVEQSLAGIYVIQDEVFQYVNPTFAGMIGYSQSEMTGMHLAQTVVDEACDDVLKNYFTRISGETASIRYLTVGRHKDGHGVPLDVHGTRLTYRGRPAVVGVGIDVTERVRREQELQESRRSLQALTAHLNHVREEQRSKIARELHDVIGGMLTSVKIELARIGRRVSDGQVRHIVDEAMELTQATIETVRRLSEELRPAVLDHLGLAAAIRERLEQYSRSSGTHFEMTPRELEIDISPERATCVYRVFQEALTNIARHAQAGRVQVYLELLERNAAPWLKMVVADDGRGMDIKSSPVGKTLGLASMSERAREMGGELDFEPAAGRGTVLTLWVPCGHGAMGSAS
ncbi:MAG: PAS domain S-box protein [Zoogloea sp.]|nr:PAS domain S-box protein [Zoogloea sp.]